MKEKEGKLREENANLKKKIAEVPAVRYAGSELQHKISEISGVEVPMQAVNELVRQFGSTGQILDDENIQALCDCNVFGIWSTAYQEYVEALAKAMDGGGASSFDGSLDGEDSSDASVEDESLLAWERENG